MGGFYHDFASFFRQYKVDKCFSYISISSAFDQANRADRPAGIIVNRAVDLLSLCADQILVRNKVDADQVFSGTWSPWGGKLFCGSFSHFMMFSRIGFDRALKISNSFMS